jgi:hypothetical protein
MIGDAIYLNISDDIIAIAVKVMNHHGNELLEVFEV